MVLARETQAHGVTALRTAFTEWVRGIEPRPDDLTCGCRDAARATKEVRRHVMSGCCLGRGVQAGNEIMAQPQVFTLIVAAGGVFGQQLRAFVDKVAGLIRVDRDSFGTPTMAIVFVAGTGTLAGCDLSQAIVGTVGEAQLFAVAWHLRDVAIGVGQHQSTTVASALRKPVARRIPPTPIEAMLDRRQTMASRLVVVVNEAIPRRDLAQAVAGGVVTIVLACEAPWAGDGGQALQGVVAIAFDGMSLMLAVA